MADRREAELEAEVARCKARLVERVSALETSVATLIEPRALIRRLPGALFGASAAAVMGLILMRRRARSRSHERAAAPGGARVPGLLDLLLRPGIVSAAVPLVQSLLGSQRRDDQEKKTP